MTTATPTPRPTPPSRPTAPLPDPAVVEAVTRHEAARACYVRLLQISPVLLTDDEFEELCESRRAMADAYQTLHNADMLHLLRPATARDETATPRPTAPLPQPAVAAVARLERVFPPAEVVTAVARFESAAARFDELIARPADELSDAEVEAYTGSQQTMADAFAVLAEAGRTDLLKPLETADRYRNASAHYRELAAARDFEGCEYVRDEMAMCRCQLAAAGRLDLIGVA